MTKEVKNFEHLWEDAEQVSEKKYGLKDFNSLIKELQDLITDLSKIDNLSTDLSVKNFIKQKKIGEILFKLCQFSNLEKINVYEALMNEIELEKL